MLICLLLGTLNVALTWCEERNLTNTQTKILNETKLLTKSQTKLNLSNGPEINSELGPIQQTSQGQPVNVRYVQQTPCGPGLFTSLQLVLMPDTDSVKAMWDVAKSCTTLNVNQSIVYLYTHVGDCAYINMSRSHTIQMDAKVRAYVLLNIAPWRTLQVTLKGSGRYNSISSSLITHETVPTGSPSNMRSASVRNDSAHLRWEPPECASRGGISLGYDVNVTGLEAKDNFGSTVIRSPKPDVTVKGLRPFSRYRAMVRYVNNKGASSYSHPVEFRTSEARPGPPMIYNFTYDYFRIGLVLVPPNQPNGIITDFDIKIEGKNLSEIKHMLFTTPRFVIENLKRATEYKLWTRVSNRAGVSPWSNVLTVMTKSTASPKPKYVWQTFANETCVGVGWLPASGDVKAYRVTVKSNDSHEWTRRLDRGARSHLMCGLDAYREYAVLVSVETPLGATGDPSTTLAWTEGLTPPEPPSPEILEWTSSTVTIRINPVKPFQGPISGYEIRVKNIHDNRNTSHGFDERGLSAINFTDAADKSKLRYKPVSSSGGISKYRRKKNTDKVSIMNPYIESEVDKMHLKKLIIHGKLETRSQTKLGISRRLKRAAHSLPGVIWLELEPEDVQPDTKIEIGNGESFRGKRNEPLKPSIEYAIILVAKSTVVDVTKHSYSFAKSTAITKTQEGGNDSFEYNNIQIGQIVKGVIKYSVKEDVGNRSDKNGKHGTQEFICGVECIAVISASVVVFLILVVSSICLIKYFINRCQRRKQRLIEADDGKNSSNNESGGQSGDDKNDESLILHHSESTNVSKVESYFNRTRSLNEPRYITSLRQNIRHVGDPPSYNDITNNNWTPADNSDVINKNGCYMEHSDATYDEPSAVQSYEEVIFDETESVSENDNNNCVLESFSSDITINLTGKEESRHGDKYLANNLANLNYSKIEQPVLSQILSRDSLPTQNITLTSISPIQWKDGFDRGAPGLHCSTPCPSFLASSNSQAQRRILEMCAKNQDNDCKRNTNIDSYISTTDSFTIKTNINEYSETINSFNLNANNNNDNTTDNGCSQSVVTQANPFCEVQRTSLSDTRDSRNDLCKLNTCDNSTVQSAEKHEGKGKDKNQTYSYKANHNGTKNIMTIDKHKISKLCTLSNIPSYSPGNNDRKIRKEVSFSFPTQEKSNSTLESSRNHSLSPASECTISVDNEKPSSESMNSEECKSNASLDNRQDTKLNKFTRHRKSKDNHLCIINTSQEKENHRNDFKSMSLIRRLFRTKKRSSAQRSETPKFTMNRGIDNNESTKDRNSIRQDNNSNKKLIGTFDKFKTSQENKCKSTVKDDFDSSVRNTDSSNNFNFPWWLEKSLPKSGQKKTKVNKKHTLLEFYSDSENNPMVFRNKTQKSDTNLNARSNRMTRQRYDEPSMNLQVNQMKELVTSSESFDHTPKSRFRTTRRNHPKVTRYKNKLIRDSFAPSSSVTLPNSRNTSLRKQRKPRNQKYFENEHISQLKNKLLSNGYLEHGDEFSNNHLTNAQSYSRAAKINRRKSRYNSKLERALHNRKGNVPENLNFSESSNKHSKDILQNSSEDDSSEDDIKPKRSRKRQTRTKVTRSRSSVVASKNDDKFDLSHEGGNHSKSRKSSYNFNDEFEDLEKYRMYLNKTLDYKISSRNMSMNKLSEVRPPDITLVDTGYSQEGNGNYYNGSYMVLNTDVNYIAAQSPFSTITSNIFWNLVLHNSVETVVFLGDCNENGQLNCHKYWASSGVFISGGILALTEEEEIFADYAIRKIKLTSPDYDDSTVTQFQFLTWPHSGILDDPIPLLDFRCQIRRHHGNKNSPILVHCRSGSGRTAVFIAVDTLIDEYSREGSVKVYSFVKKMRRSRPTAIRNFQQYNLIYQCLFEEFEAGDTTVGNDVRRVFKELNRRNPKTGNIYLRDQFELLSTYSPQLPSEKCHEALVSSNRLKNRLLYIIPPDMHRPSLKSLKGRKVSNTYINAVFLNSLRNKNEYIITQTPSSETVSDFWQMVCDYCIQTIVHIGNCNGFDLEQYFPLRGTSEFQQFKVTLGSVEQNECVVVRNLKLDNPPGRKIAIRHLNLDLWQEETLPPPRLEQWASSRDVLHLISLFKKWHAGVSKKSRHVLFVCTDGATNSGLVAAAALLCERILEDGYADIYHLVKHIRRRRPAIVADYNQYRFLYKIILEYVKRDFQFPLSRPMKDIEDTIPSSDFSFELIEDKKNKRDKYQRPKNNQSVKTAKNYEDVVNSSDASSEFIEDKINKRVVNSRPKNNAKVESVSAIEEAVNSTGTSSKNLNDEENMRNCKRPSSKSNQRLETFEEQMKNERSELYGEINEEVRELKNNVLSHNGNKDIHTASTSVAHIPSAYSSQSKIETKNRTTQFVHEVNRREIGESENKKYQNNVNDWDVSSSISQMSVEDGGSTIENISSKIVKATESKPLSSPRTRTIQVEGRKHVTKVSLSPRYENDEDGNTRINNPVVPILVSPKKSNISEVDVTEVQSFVNASSSRSDVDIALHLNF